MVRRIRTIDSHTAGEPLRLIVDGFPPIRGATMLEKRADVRRRHDRLRRALMLEPRGHADMYGALLTEPVTTDADAGVLFMHNEGYSTMCGHGVIAVATIVTERGLIVPRASGRLALDTPAGLVRCVLTSGSPQVRLPAPSLLEGKPDATGPGSSASPSIDAVAFVNVPSFVLHAALPIRAAGRAIRADVAFGGAFYAIVDSESAGVPLRTEALPALRQIGMEIKAAVEAVLDVKHPETPELRGLYGTIFTGPPEREGSALRNVTVFADAEVDRSPCGTGTCAVMAVLDLMGLLSADQPFIHESLIGTTFAGTVVDRTTVGEHPAIVPSIEGSAYITGEHTFLIDDRDPLKDGFRL